MRGFKYLLRRYLEPYGFRGRYIWDTSSFEGAGLRKLHFLKSSTVWGFI